MGFLKFSFLSLTLRTTTPSPSLLRRGISPAI